MSFRVLVLYYTMNGSTKRVAEKIAEGLSREEADISLITIAEAGDIDYFDYDLICLGFPSIHWHVPAPVEQYLKSQFQKHTKEGRIVPGAPRIGKDAVLFCTYCGTHTGIKEAIPAVKYAGQFFEHVGFTIADEWYIVGEYKGNEPNNRYGRLGDVSGLPDDASLEMVCSAARNLASRLCAEKNIAKDK